MKAEREVIAAQAAAQAKRMDGLTDAEIMQAKGYNQKDVLQTEMQKAYAEAIGNMGPDTISGGSGGSSVMSEMMNMGMGMAAMNAMTPQFNNMMQRFGNMGQSGTSTMSSDKWNCSCGNTGVVGNFCNNCGARRPDKSASWDCSCGYKGIIGNFCNNCGAKRGE